MHFSVPSSFNSIHHDGSSLYVVNRSTPHGDHRLGDTVTVRLRVGLDAPIERILLRASPDGEQRFVEMQHESDEHACRWWRARLTLTMPSVNYRFLLLTAQGIWWYNARGVHREMPTDVHDFQLLADYAAPSWVRDSVFYQIFPDRFSRGRRNTRSLQPPGKQGSGVDLRGWGEPPTVHGRGSTTELFGGDLAGIRQHLDVIAELGVNALYLNPIFTAYTNHRYDVADYYNVDPRLGGNDAFIALRRAAKKRGLRLILDIVPNHCGVKHPWFQSAIANAHALSADFFTFYKHPDAYECWLGVKSLPKLNYHSTRLRRLMYAGPRGVFRYWLRAPFAIDGWRIDVANMLARQGETQLNLEVLRGIRKAVKEENPSAYLMGENYFDASAQLQGDCLDGVMNYAGFTIPLWNWLRRFEIGQHGEPRHISSPSPLTTLALAETLQASRALIPWVIAQQQFNLLSSHDTSRILSNVHDDPHRNRAAAGLLMTYVGVPSIYYGDEVGMKGPDHMSGRACMSWDRSMWVEELRDFYKTLIALRRRSEALTRGGFQVLHAEDDTLAFLRDAKNEKLVVVAHRGPSMGPSEAVRVATGGIADGTELRELFSSASVRVEQGHMRVPAMPAGIAIWRVRK